MDLLSDAVRFQLGGVRFLADQDSHVFEACAPFEPSLGLSGAMRDSEPSMKRTGLGKYKPVEHYA